MITIMRDNVEIHIISRDFIDITHSTWKIDLRFLKICDCLLIFHVVCKRQNWCLYIFFFFLNAQNAIFLKFFEWSLKNTNNIIELNVMKFENNRKNIAISLSFTMKQCCNRKIHIAQIAIHIFIKIEIVDKACQWKKHNFRLQFRDQILSKIIFYFQLIFDNFEKINKTKLRVLSIVNLSNFDEFENWFKIAFNRHVFNSKNIFKLKFDNFVFN